MAAAAPAAGKGKRKRHLFEDDVYLLLHRYAPGTILTALQEVAQHAEDRRIDWRAVVGKSATGITSAREYQMLWRHFAYHHDLDDSVDDGDQPLGDDSDLELELEPNPIPTKEALSEASALVKASVSHKRVGLTLVSFQTAGGSLLRMANGDRILKHKHCDHNVLLIE